VKNSGVSIYNLHQYQNSRLFSPRRKLRPPGTEAPDLIWTI